LVDEMKTESENEKLSPEEATVDDREKEGRRTIIYGAGGGIRTHAARMGHRLFVFLSPGLGSASRRDLLPTWFPAFYMALGYPGLFRSLLTLR